MSFGFEFLHARKRLASDIQRHLRVVRNLAREEIQPAATDEFAQSVRKTLVHLLTRHEFDRTSQRVTAGQSDQASEVSIQE